MRNISMSPDSILYIKMQNGTSDLSSYENTMRTLVSILNVKVQCGKWCSAKPQQLPPPTKTTYVACVRTTFKSSTVRLREDHHAQNLQVDAVYNSSASTSEVIQNLLSSSSRMRAAFGNSKCRTILLSWKFDFLGSTIFPGLGNSLFADTYGLGRGASFLFDGNAHKVWVLKPEDCFILQVPETFCVLHHVCMKSQRAYFHSQRHMR